MQTKKMTTLVELIAQLGVDGDICGVRLKSMFIDPNYKEEESGQNLQKAKFECLCCDLNYVVSLEVEKEQKPELDVIKIFPEIGSDYPTVIIKQENPLEAELSEVTYDEPAEDPPEQLVETVYKPETPVQTVTKTVTHPFQCQMCPQNFITRKFLSLHITRLHRQFECDYCHAIVEGKQKLQNHFVIEHGKGIECPTCFDVFSNNRRLAAHMVSHSTKMVKCSECSFQTKYQRSLDRHKLLHSEMPKNICESCGKIFSEKGNLRAHLRRMHKIEPGSSQPARKLSKKMLEQQKLKAENEAAVGEVPCPDCGKTYGSGKALHLHLYYCKKKLLRRHPCNECDKAFAWPCALSRHIKTTHQKECVRCSYCGGSYASMPSLYCHINAVHTKKRKYECEFCDKFFYFKESRDNHRRIHTGERLQCPYEGCTRSIRDSASFWKHKKQHKVNGDKLRE